MNAIFAADALLPDGWASDVRLDWDAAGVLTRIERDVARPPDVPLASGPVIPGMPNLHSHAFQRAFAGLTEVRGAGDASGGGDSFWTWRELMYGYALAVTPAMLEAIATHLYIRMLQGGYTSVCEFHYVHNDVDGKPYADDATMSRALLAAARRAGIGVALLPVLYRHNGFCGVPPRAEQRRFVRDVDGVVALVEALRRDVAGPRERVGFAAHSLRAVAPDALAAALDGMHAIDPAMPIHVHIAEQRREVLECVAALGQRPVAWLVDHVAVDARWCLVHATHMDAAECVAAARTGAVAGLCPTTEANLGDGTFDLPRWRDAGGAWGIGSDSHVCVDAGLELAMLEYGQRLATGRRNVAAGRREPWVATAMTTAAVAGGARAAGCAVAGLAAGASADFAVLDARHPALAGLDAPAMLSAAVFAADRASAIRHVVVGGEIRIRDGRHAIEDAASAAFVAARRALAAAVRR
jgi:formimidoylglutamate deiminase